MEKVHEEAEAAVAPDDMEDHPVPEAVEVPEPVEVRMYEDLYNINW